MTYNVGVFGKYVEDSCNTRHASPRSAINSRPAIRRWHPTICQSTWSWNCCNPAL